MQNIPSVTEIHSIQSVFIDFDGTLFSHLTGSIPSSAIEAINTLEENGIKVFICTGRSPYEIRDFDLSKIRLNGMILSNGQLVFDENNEVIFSCPIEGTLKEKLLSIFNEKKIPIYFSTIDDLFISFNNETVERIQRSVSTEVPYIKEYEGEEIYMASAFFSSKDEINVLKSLEEHAFITWWHEGAIDIVPKGISKAKGIDEVLKYYDLDPTKTLAIGDGENDIEMFLHCAHSIAMGNATKQTKKAAAYVTADIDEDGLYKGLQHYGLL